jgi:hypothetical protein
VGDDHQSLKLEREEWESDSGEERGKHKKKPSKCRAVGENLVAHERVGGYQRRPMSTAKDLLVAGGFDKLCLRFFVLASFLFRSWFSLSLAVVLVY